MIDKDNNGVSIITCTNRSNYMSNIFDNYKRQNYNKKELIIILNNNKLNNDDWKQKSKLYNNVRIFKLDENISLGYCYNFGVNKAKYDYIAKFDDDDYYGPKYLEETMKAFKNTQASIVGKGTYFVYFEKLKKLGITKASKENSYVTFVAGPTLVFKKKILEKVKFRDISLTEDKYFQQDSLKNGFKIYSTNRYNFVYIRHGASSKHSWKISDKDFLKHCKIIDTIKEYQSYVNKKSNSPNPIS